MLTYRDIVATAKAEGYQSASKDRCYPKSQDMLYALKIFKNLVHLVLCCILPLGILTLCVFHLAHGSPTISDNSQALKRVQDDRKEKEAKSL